MKKALSAWSAVLGAALVVVSCSDAIGPETEFLVQEAWAWDSACCGVAGDARTAESEGFLHLLRFSRDGLVRAVRNDTVLVETSFSVRRSSPIDFEDEITVITYGEPIPLGPGIEPASRQMAVPLEGGRLLLRNLDGCADCFGDWVFLARLE